MFSDIKLLYLTQDSCYTPSCFTGGFLRKCLYFSISKTKIGNNKYEIGKGKYAPLLCLFLSHYATKKSIEKRVKKAQFFEFLPQNYGQSCRDN